MLFPPKMKISLFQELTFSADISLYRLTLCISTANYIIARCKIDINRTHCVSNLP